MWSAKGSFSDESAEGSRSSREPLRVDELWLGIIRQGELISGGVSGGSKGASELTSTADAAREDRDERRGRDDVDDSVHGSSTRLWRSPSWSAFAGTGAPSRAKSAASPVASSGRTAFAALAATFGRSVGRTEQAILSFGRSSLRHVEGARQVAAKWKGRKDETKADVCMLGVCRLGCAAQHRGGTGKQGARTSCGHIRGLEGGKEVDNSTQLSATGER